MADLNTQFPSWLAQQSWLLRQDRQNVGNEFLQGAQLGANIRHQRAQEDIAAREMDYRNRTLELQRDAFDLKRQGQLQMNEGTVALGKTLSEIAATGTWDSPESEAKFWETVRLYPRLSQSPSFDNLIGIFDRAKQAKLQRDLAADRAKRGFAPGELEKDLTYYQDLLANPDTPPEILSLAQARLQSKAQGTGVTVKFGPEGTVSEVIYGKQAAPGAAGAPTVAFQTQLQQQLHAYDNSMALLNHIEQNINASDFGLRGMAKELQSRIGGQFGLGVPPEQMDVRNSLKQLRQNLYKALRSDTNISDPERKSIERMLPEVEMFDVAESLPNAVGKLLTVKRTLNEASRSAAQRLGVSPPLWTMNPDEIRAKFGDMSANAIKAQVQAGKLSQDDAVQIIQQLNIPLYPAPTDQGPAPLIE